MAAHFAGATAASAFGVEENVPDAAASKACSRRFDVCPSRTIRFARRAGGHQEWLWVELMCATRLSSDPCAVINRILRNLKKHLRSQIVGGPLLLICPSTFRVEGAPGVRSTPHRQLQGADGAYLDSFGCGKRGWKHRALAQYG